MTTNELKELCFKILDESKAHEITAIDVHENSSIADLMIICTGTSNRHVSAIAGRLEMELKKQKASVLAVSGETVGEWVVVDLGEIMVHILQDEHRRRYDLDDLYRCMAAGV